MEFLVFVTFCVTIATLIVVASLNSKNKKADQKIDGLYHAVDALHYKVDTLQRSSSVVASEQRGAEGSRSLLTCSRSDEVAESERSERTAKQPPVSTMTAQGLEIASPAVQARNDKTGIPAQVTAAQPPAQPARQTPVQPAAHMAAPTPAPTPAPAQQQNVPIQSPQTRQQAPVQVPQTQPYPYAQAMPPVKSSANMEKIIGKNILPFLAAGMVFIGLIFLAILVVPTMSDIQRFIAMFALSGAIFAVGFVLARRKKNVFSVALLGTGIGALFISILMTRIYFNYLGDIPTFTLLLVWMIACMGLVKMFNSLTLSITAHVGMVISVIFAFTQGFDQQRALIVVAYQVVATIVIVGGSLLAYRKTYRFGLLASLALTIVATIAIRSQDLAEFSTSVIVASYLIQFVTASAVSFFLATSSAKLSKDDRLAFHYINKLAWIILTILALYPAIYQWLDSALHVTPSDNKALIVNTVPSVVLIVIFLAHAFISAFLERTINMPTDMVRVSVIATISAAAVMALYRSTISGTYDGIIAMPFICIIALFALAISRLLHARIYTILAIVLLCIDALIAATTIFISMADYSPTLCYVWIAAIMATSVLIYATWLPAASRRAFLPGFILLNLVFFEITFPQPLAHILDWNDLELLLPITLIVTIAIVTVLRVINVEIALGMSRAYHVMFAANEYILAAVAVLGIFVNFYYDAFDTQNILLWIVTVMVVAICFMRIIQSRNVSALHPQPIQYLSAITLTLITQAPLVGLMKLGNAYPFVSSVVGMFVALVLVGMGFALRLKPVRLYGLGLTIFAVLKLATYDLSNISSVGRVIAFIVGGLIAFGISALYNYADKRLNPSRAGNLGAPAPMPYPAMPQAGVPQGIPQPIAGYPVTGQIPMTGQMPTGQVPTGQVPMGTQVPMQAHPMVDQPAPVQPATGQPVMPQTAGNPQPQSALGTHEEDGR